MIIGWPSQISSSFSFRCWRMGSLELIKLGFEKRWIDELTLFLIIHETKFHVGITWLCHPLFNIWKWHRLVLGGVGLFEVFSYITLSADPPLPSPPNQKHLLEANYVASNNSKRSNFFSFPDNRWLCTRLHCFWLAVQSSLIPVPIRAMGDPTNGSRQSPLGGDVLGSTCHFNLFTDWQTSETRQIHTKHSGANNSCLIKLVNM